MSKKLLLLHGALGTKDQFSILKKHLPIQFEVFDLNFDGHGDKESTKDFSINLFSENVIDFLIANNIDKVNIFGYSMGGYVGLNVAKKAPHLVDKIITLGTKFDWTKESAEKEIKMLNPKKIEEKVPAFAKKLESIHKSNNWIDVVNQTAKMMFELGSGGRLTNRDFAHINQKILIGIGSQDKMVSIDESVEVASYLPNGTLKIIEDFEHQIEKTDFKKLAEVILNFLD